MIPILSYCIFLITRTLHATYRYRFLNNEVLIELKRKRQNYIFAIWHQNLFAGILAQTGHRHIVIVSRSNDAEPVAFTCMRLGHLVVRGSSKRGNVDKNGQAAKTEMIECLKQGFPGAVTVDGPKGPAFKVKPGIIDMAKKSEALIVPYTVCPKNYWEFKSWDKFRLPKPFSPILISYGKPLKVDSNCESFENLMNELEVQMNLEKDQTSLMLTNWKQYPGSNWWQ